MEPHIYRTPEKRFSEIPDFEWEPRYVDVDDLRMAGIDEGSGPTVLLLHGEPSWSFLYRSMIPPLLDAGLRVVAPDLIGFGRSDKPSDRGLFTYQRHLDWLKGWFDATCPDPVTLFCQDWGGLLGLRLVASNPDRFDRVAAGNTGLPTGDQAMQPAFEAWRQFSLDASSFDIGRIIQNGTVRDLSDVEVAAYDAPFSTEESKAAARVFPSLVPAHPDDPAAEPNREAWAKLTSFDKPFLCLFSDSDPITAGADRPFHKLVPGTQGQPHATIRNAGHFLQEDAGPEIAKRLIEWME